MADPPFTNAYFSNPFTIDNCVFLNFNGVTFLKASCVITIDFPFSPRLLAAARGCRRNDPPADWFGGRVHTQDLRMTFVCTRQTPSNDVTDSIM